MLQTSNVAVIYANPEKLDAQGIIIETLSQAFTKLGLPKKALYSFMCEYKLGKQELDVGDDGFAFALQDAFGVGAFLIEIEVMRSIKQRFPSFKVAVKGQGNWDFQGYLLEFNRFIGSF